MRKRGGAHETLFTLIALIALTGLSFGSPAALGSRVTAGGSLADHHRFRECAGAQDSIDALGSGAAMLLP
jgi:hypothetical protein